jgi:hypothetical protein
MIRVRATNPNGNEFSQAEILCREILDSDMHVCGFDTETTVPNATNIPSDGLTSVIQICIRKNSNGKILPLEIETNDIGIYTCYIIPIRRIYLEHKDIPSNLNQLLTSSKIIKTGVNIKLDAKKVNQSYKIEMDGIIDLQDLAISNGNFDYGLNALAKKYLNLSKLDSELGNYDGILTYEQIMYSAYDAYLSLAIYNKMLNIELSGPYFYFPDGQISSKLKIMGINIEKEDALHVLEFLKSAQIFQVQNKEYSIDSIYNHIFNNYNYWPKDNLLKDKMMHSLQMLSDLKLITRNINGTWKLVSDQPTYSDVFNHRVSDNEFRSVDDTKHLEGINVIQNGIQNNNINVTQNDDDNMNDQIFQDLIKTYEDTVYNMCRKIIKNHGIKRSSLLNSLENSLPKSLYNREYRAVIYSRAIDSLISAKLLHTDTADKIYLIN